MNKEKNLSPSQGLNLSKIGVSRRESSGGIKSSPNKTIILIHSPAPHVEYCNYQLYRQLHHRTNILLSNAME